MSEAALGEWSDSGTWGGFEWRDFNHVWIVAEGCTVHDRAYAEAIYELTVHAKDGPGNRMAEFGVGAAGMALVMEYGLANATETERKHLDLFDTFRGFPIIPHETLDPGLNYGDEFFGHADGAIILMAERHRTMYVGDFQDYYIPEDAAYDLVHLDCSLYESYQRGLASFWPRVVPGGIMVIGQYDDERYPGCRKAVEESGLEVQAFGPLWIVSKPES